MAGVYPSRDSQAYGQAILPNEEELAKQRRLKAYYEMLQQDAGGLESPILDPIDVITGLAGYTAASKLAGAGASWLASKTPVNAAISSIPKVGPQMASWMAKPTASLGEHAAMNLPFAVADNILAETLPEDTGALTHLGASLAGGLTLGQAPRLLNATVNNPAFRQAALKPLSNETGAIPNPAKFLRAAGNGILDMPLAPTQGPFKGAADVLGGNTLRQFFVHPRDRMPEKAGQAFGQVVTASQRVSNVIGSASTKLAGLNLEERQFFTEAVKQMAKGKEIGDIPGITPEVANKLHGLLGPAAEALATNKSIVTVGPRTRTMHDRAMTRAVLRTFSQDMNDPVWKLHIDNAAKSGTDITTADGTKKFLSELISNPNTAENVRANATHLYNLGATTGRELTARTKGVYENVLARRVLDNPQWVKLKGGSTDDYIDAVSDTGLPPKPTAEDKDWVSIPGHKEFEHYLVKREIAEGFKDLDATQGQARALYNTYILNPWKTTKVLWNIAAKPRDLFSNLMFNDIGGKHPLSPMNVKHYAESYKKMNVSDPDYKEYLRLTGGSPGALINSTDPNPILQASKQGAGIPGVMLRLIYDPDMQIKVFGKGLDKNPVGQYTELMGSISKWTDDWAKFSKFQWNRSKGMDAASAADDAVKTVGDMSRQTPAVKLVRDSIMPFFGWQAHAVKSVGSGMINHPVRTAKYFALPYMAGSYAVEKLGITNEEFEDIRQNLPKYMQGGLGASKAYIPLPYRDEKDRIQFMDVGWWIPGLQDIADLERNSGNPMNYVQNPVLTVAADLKHNKSFTGQPIWFEWDDTETKTMKALHYMYQQFTPAFAPGGSMWQKAQLAGSEDPNRPTIPQAIGPLVGYRVKAVDTERAEGSNAARIGIYQKEAERQMVKELTRTSDPNQQEAIREKYQPIFDRINLMYTEGIH